MAVENQAELDALQREELEIKKKELEAKKKESKNYAAYLKAIKNDSYVNLVLMEPYSQQFRSNTAPYQEIYTFSGFGKIDRDVPVNILKTIENEYQTENGNAFLELIINEILLVNPSNGISQGGNPIFDTQDSIIEFRADLSKKQYSKVHPSHV